MSRPLVSVLTFVSLVLNGIALEVRSPDGQIVFSMGFEDRGALHGCPTYSVRYRDKTLIEHARMGLELEGESLDHGFAIASQEKTGRDETWKPVCGERELIRDHFNGLVVELQQSAAPHRLLRIDIRAYNEGVAFAYTVPKQAGLDSVAIVRERTQFRFPDNWPAWVAYKAQGVYEKMPLSTTKPGCERPLVVEAGNNVFVALAEARLVDYGRMKFRRATGETNTLDAFLDDDKGHDSPVTGHTPFTSPWRVIMAASSPGALLENNFLIANLNDPCEIADTSWIKPGKVIREGTLTTTGAKACIDFAAKHRMQYVEFDAGWYGDEYSRASDASHVSLDPKRSKGPLDILEAVRYGEQRGIGIILYVNHIALERQLDDILPLYRQWGIKGIKFGFVNVGSQHWTAWLHEAIRKCATNRFMVDVHDEYRPTGFSRTYPNLMSAEGIRGDETSPTNSQTLAIAFTRMLAGPADNTVCYYDARVRRLASHAYQLAKPVCLFSPWQFLFWYDRPSMPGMGQSPELEFWDAMPTTWDETRVLEGRIGEYISVARRSGNSWFIGCMNGEEARTFQLPLDFLPAGKTYQASIYTDDASVATATHVGISRQMVRSGPVPKSSSSDEKLSSSLSLRIGANQGATVRLSPSE